MTTRRIIKNADEFDAIREELVALAEARDAASGIVQHPDWIAFEIEGRADVSTAHVVVITGDDGRILGYAPFLAHYHHARVAFGSHRVPIYRGRALRLLGSGVVAAPADRAIVEHEVAAALGRDRGIRVVRVQESELPSSIAEAMVREGNGFTMVHANLQDQVKWTIGPYATPAEWLAGMDAKRRGDLSRRMRSCYRKLGETAHMRVFVTPEDFESYGRLMNAVYAKSWHAAEVAVDWDEPARRALFARLSAKGQVVGHLMMLGERPIAYVHGYRMGGRYVLDDTGYDEAFAALGVGSSLVFQAICDLMERHPGEIIDFGYGDNQYKRVLATDSTPCGSLYVIRGARAAACFRLLGPLRWFYRRVKRMRVQATHG